jgi:hypothetical protein
MCWELDPQLAAQTLQGSEAYLFRDKDFNGRNLEISCMISV